MKIAIQKGKNLRALEKQENPIIIDTDKIVACESSREGCKVHMEGGFTFLVDEHSMRDIFEHWPGCPYRFDTITCQPVERRNDEGTGD